MELFAGLDLPEEVKKTLTERINGEIEAIKEGVKNDSDFIESVRSKEAAKFFGSMESIFKRNFSFDDDDIPADVSGNKKMELMLKTGLAKLEQNKDATNQELQQKYLDINAEFQKYKDEVVPTLLEEKDKSYQSRFIDDGILKDTLEYEVTCRPEFAPSLVDAYLHKNGYKKVWDAEKGTYDIVVAKDNLKPTKEGKAIDGKQIIEMALDDAGVLKKSNGNDPKEKGQPQQKRSNGQLSENAQRMMDTMTIVTREQ